MGGTLRGLRVVELACGVTELGAGLASSLPGLLLSEQEAEVVRIVDRVRPDIDTGLEGGRVWNRGKRVLTLDLDEPGDLSTAKKIVHGSDIVLAFGSQEQLEERGLDYASVASADPRVVYCHVAPSETLYAGVLPDHDILVQAASGLMTQLPGNRPGPIVCDFPTASYGAALVATAGAMAALVERERTGRGRRIETSLYDGQFALMGLVVHRADRVPPSTLAVVGGDRSDPTTTANRFWLFECADGGWLHLHPGARGAMQRLSELFEPGRQEPAPTSPEEAARSYFARIDRWSELIRTKDRATMLAELWAANVPAQPALRPGEALRDEHMLVTGLAADQADPDHATMLSVGRTVRVEPGSGGDGEATTRMGRAGTPSRPLEGVRVLDFGAWIAGPTANQVMADLGADVVKVEPFADYGGAISMRGYVWERGKRSLGIDLKSPRAGEVLERLFRWTDVVHHNLRPGVPERLGIDAATAHALNPRLIYCQSPSFGTTGPKAQVPGFDQTTQAFCGIEMAAGGEGNAPIWIPWAPCDAGGGYLAASGMLFGLYAMLRGRGGQVVEASQMAAGLLAKSAVFWADGELVPGAALDHGQTGYGPGYRIYRTSDGSWLALVVTGQDAWRRLRGLPELSRLPEPYAGLRAVAGEAAREAESVLEDAFAGRPASEWLDLLQPQGIACTLVLEPDRDGFLGLFFDDPANRELGRAHTYEHDVLGEADVIGFPYRFSGSRAEVPWAPPPVGHHTNELLTELGFSESEIESLVSDRVVGLLTAEPAGQRA